MNECFLCGAAGSVFIARHVARWDQHFDSVDTSDFDSRSRVSMGSRVSIECLSGQWVCDPCISVALDYAAERRSEPKGKS